VQGIEQRTEEWYAARCGKITASRIGDLMARTKSGPAATRKNYIAELVAERLTGKPADHYTNAAMQWGIDQEPFAIGTYEATRNVLVETCGFIIHPDFPDSGASPDGLVGKDGLIEVKCPNTATHIATIRGAPIDRKYQLQMQWQMACTLRYWCDWVSYDPRLPEHLRLFVTRIPRDNDIIRKITIEVVAALSEIEEILKDLREWRGKRAVS